LWGQPANYQCANVVVGVDYWGDDLYIIEETNLDDCCKACSDDPNCGSYTFNHNINKCVIKSGLGES